MSPQTDARARRPGWSRWSRWPRRAWAVVAGCLAVFVAASLIAYAVTPRPASLITGASQAAGTMTSNPSGPGAGLPELGNGRPAPAFALPRLGGGSPVTLTASPGHPVVLNFWASWCTNCRDELAAFAQVSQRYAGRVTFLAVDTNDHDPQQAQSLLAGAGDRYPVGVDSQAQVANGKYLVEALPATVFITADGRIAGEAFGTQTAASLESWIRALTH